jgi:carbonic anhydrase
MKLLKMVASSVLLTTTIFAAEYSTHWGYTGHASPEHWGDLDSKNVMCKLGHNQSPINITRDIEVDTKNLEPIHFNYNSESSSVVDNGHTIQVNIKKGSSIAIDGKVFELKQFHFHTPSENEIDGKHFPLEAHLVHMANDGSLAVVAILFEEGEENPLLQKVWAKMPHKAGEKAKVAVTAEEINKFLPKDKSYYRFDGSLTTPPCSEGVRWFVFKLYDTVSKAQVEEFLHVMHHPNNRPIQDIGARKVLD